MKKRLTFSQVAEIYCTELGVDIPQMETYLRAIFNDEPTEEIEKEIEEIISKSYDKKSEFFPEYNKPPSRIA